MVHEDIEIIVIDKNFKRIKAIKSFSSLQWRERYFGCGEFELHCDKRFLEPLFEGEYIFRKNKNYMGIIEYRLFDNIENKVVVKGRFLESILEDRILRSQETYSGKAEDICRSLVNDFCINSNPIANLVLGNYNGLGSEMQIQNYGRNIYEVITDILNQQELSFRIKYDLTSKNLAFEVFQGLDRTKNQHQNGWCVFSSSFFNLLDEKYESSNYIKNFAYVIGKDKNDRDYVVSVDNSNGDKIREIQIDAGDIKWNSNLSEAQFAKCLHDRGLEKLAEYNIAETVECDIDVYKTSKFELGDKCTYVQKEIDLIAEGRVTEILEVIEANGVKTRVTLGKEQLSVVQKMKRGSMV